MRNLIFLFFQMASSVEYFIEKQVTFLKELEHEKLLTTSEIKKILIKKQKFEYKLHRNCVLENDLIQYIKFESLLLALFKKRKCDVKFQMKLIHALHEKLIQKFPSIANFIRFINFTSSPEHFSSKKLNHVIGKSIQIHPREPFFYLTASNFYLKNQNFNAARVVLQRALRLCSNQQLWKEYLSLELKFAQHIAKESPDSEVTSDFAIATIVYKNALKEYNNVAFNLELLVVYIKNTQKIDLLENLLESEIPESKILSKFLSSFKGEQYLQLLELIVEAFTKKGVDTIFKEYFTFLHLQLQAQENGHLVEFFKTTISELFNSCVPTVDYYLLKYEYTKDPQHLEMGLKSFNDIELWLKLCETLDTKVFERALDRYPENKEIWAQYLIHIQSQDYSESGENVFRNAMKVHDFGIMFIEYLMKSGDFDPKLWEFMQTSHSKETWEHVVNMKMEWNAKVKYFERAHLLYPSQRGIIC